MSQPSTQGPKSADLFAQAKTLIPGGVNSPVRAFRSVGGNPFFVDRAKGSRVWDVDGRELLDYVGTWGPAILGHAPDVVVDAVRTAAAQGGSFGIPNPYEVEIAALIRDWVPSVEKVRMVNSGTEATMSAIRLARGFTGRQKVVKFEGCYHGHVDSLLVAAGSGALTQGTPDSAGVPASFAAETIVVPFNDREALERVFAEQGHEIAALILEPIPANAGLILPDEGFHAFLRELTTRYGTVLIFDEVMTGFRVHPGGAQTLYNIKPDLTVMGKVIGGGLPSAAYGGSREIMEKISPAGPVYQAGTLSGNPLAMAAGIKTLELISKPGFFEDLDKKAAHFFDTAQNLIKEKGWPLSLNYVNSMGCLFFREGGVSNFAEAASSDTAQFADYFGRLIDKGIYAAPSQFEAMFISAAHTNSDLEFTLEAMKTILSKTYI